MEEFKRIFEMYAELMDKNVKGVELGCYSVALIGLTYAIRTVRPFSRFIKPSDIPNRFIKERRELIGRVERIEPSGGILMLKHEPLVKLPAIKDGSLPVKISGVNISGLGVNWLQAIVSGNQVQIIPVLKSKDFLHCEVILPQKTIDNKLQSVNVGESLISIGFAGLAEIEKPLLSSPKYISYYNKLKQAEEQAKKKKLGYKYYIVPTKLLLISVGQGLNKFIRKSLKSITKESQSSNKSKLALT